MASVFKDNLALVSDGKHYYAINLHGKKVSPFFKEMRFAMVEDRWLPFLCCDESGNWRIYDMSFKPIDKSSHQELSFALGFDALCFKQGDSYGVMNLEGKQLIPANYKQLTAEDYLLFGGDTQYIKDNLKIKDMRHAFLCAVDWNGNYGIISATNDVIIPFKYKEPLVMKHKGSKKYYKKNIKPYLQSEKWKNALQQMEQAKERVQARNKRLAAYPATFAAQRPATAKTQNKKRATAKTNKKLSASAINGQQKKKITIATRQQEKYMRN